MSGIKDSSRRGRREAGIDTSLPEHRVALASRLRRLRDECGRPTYRAMSELAHCSFAALSGAAAGRRLPSWETTQAYVIACLRHAGRSAEIDTILPQWRRAWEDASVREKAHRLAPADQEHDILPAAPPPPRRRVWRPAAALIVVALLATLSGSVAWTRGPTPMTGLFNILVVPFSGLPALETTLARELGEWADAEPTVAVRGPSGVDRASSESLAGIGAKHGADVVLTGRLHTAGDLWTMTIEVVLTERVFSETPEFVGRHEISLTEPADVVRGNVEVNRQLAGDAVRYVEAVVAFVRGLGRYALDDYPGAEGFFRTADGTLSGIPKTIRDEVVLLMLGNAIGRRARYPEAAEIFQRALRQSPGYARATVGLAETWRAGSPADPAGLRRALGLYQAALTQPESALLEMKTRLGLGLTYQNLTVLHAGEHWSEADEQFGAVLRAYADSDLPGEAGRQSMRLAAEARAGQALTAWQARRNPQAAIAYEEALGLLGRIDVDRPTLRDRKLILLRNLRDVYRAMHATAQADDVEARIRRAGGTT
ncbi:tetratricopeptide repeat protein [Actinoplanes sp. CA-142083]|uniref:tetratricopeptide repeat protein n=1 Tax=Actinoplanes sp. CA-142083 TaxID=3239903 RepID=UPI003D8A4D59